MCIDFRKNQTCPKPVYIKGKAHPSIYKYLGVVLDSKPNREENINSAEKSDHENALLDKTDLLESDLFVTFYHAVLCCLIVFGSVW